MSAKIVPLETDEDWEVYEKVLKPMGFRLQFSPYPAGSYSRTLVNGWFDAGLVEEHNDYITGALAVAWRAAHD